MSQNTERCNSRLNLQIKIRMEETIPQQLKCAKCTYGLINKYDRVEKGYTVI